METQLYYIGASGIPEILGQASIKSWERGSADSWTRVSGVSVTGKKVKYKKSASWHNSKYKCSEEQTGGKYIPGSNNKVWIPATATKTVEGVERTVVVKYQVRGGYTYKRTKALKKKSKMLRYDYTYAKPYQYRKVYYDNPVKEMEYITVEGSKFYTYFADIYYPKWAKDKNGTITIGDSAATPNHITHPSSVNVTFSDVNKNLNTDNANNNSSRDNKGTYVYTIVRANICTMELTWTGLSSAEGMELMAVLNSNERYKAQAGTTQSTYNNYLTVQYLDPVNNQPMTSIFYPSDRKIEKYGNGMYKSISVTLTEV